MKNKRNGRSWLCGLSVLTLCAAAGPSSAESPAAARRELPDELTLAVGLVTNVGTNVTVVLTKHSLRATNYLCGVSTPEGFKNVIFPVSTYRGYVKDDPLIYVNGNIEPGGILNLNFSENRGIVARIRGKKITIPEAKCTPAMTTGNKVVPLSSVAQRRVPTPGGYLAPRVPMRQSTWTLSLPASYTRQFDLEKVVSQVEERFNDGDFAFARDAGTAWEIETVIIQDPTATQGVDWNAAPVVKPGIRNATLVACATGVPGTNHGKHNSLAITGIHLEAGILMHEAAHLYGNPWHQIGSGDGLCGGGAFWDVNNVAFMTEKQKDRTETNFPAVVYGRPLPPRATYDFANTRVDTPVTVDVLENDYDGNGEAISLQAVGPKSDKGGTVSLSKDGKAVYTPPPGFVGQDMFAYTVADSAGYGNRSGRVKVDVRGDGLAVWYDFEEMEKESIEQRKKTNPSDGLLWLYGLVDKRPESQQMMYHFRNRGPYNGGSRGTTHWIDVVPVKGVRGNGLLNPAKGDAKAHVDLGDVGDPGRGSLSASVWVLYPEGGSGGTILCKGGMPWHGGTCPVNGWSISRNGTGFKFSGNTVRILGNEIFSLQSSERVESNRWYHLAMVMDREAGKLRGYVNGREVTAEGGNATIPEGVIEYFGPLHVFNAYGGKWWNSSKVLVDEVKLFTSVLTPKQVAELYAEGKDAPVPDLPGTGGKPAAAGGK